MSDESTFIAGKLKVADWEARKAELSGENPTSTWKDTFKDFFVQRLEQRYLKPIRILQCCGSLEGEGFSILAIQCSLIEFLASTRQGLNYQHGAEKNNKDHKYGDSQDMFVSFLRKLAPFSQTFTCKKYAKYFYVNIRCGILHEAATKNGWRIKANHPKKDAVADVGKCIVYRNNFQKAIEQYVEAYGRELAANKELQDAFIRKYDHIAKQCRTGGNESAQKPTTPPSKPKQQSTKTGDQR